MKYTSARHLMLGATALAGVSLGEAVETKDGDIQSILDKVNDSVKEMKKDFESFKDAHKEEVKELKKKGSVDYITEDKVKRIDDSLHDLTEAKTALERSLEKEKKEREELELRIQKLGKSAGSGPDLETELKKFNLQLANLAGERKQSFTPLDADGYASYKSAFDSLLRKAPHQLTQDELKVLSVGSDPDGGYLVTPDTNGSIVTKIYETSEMRQVASIQVIGTDSLEGLEDRDEAGAGYAGERAQGSDVKTPQLGKWKIPVFILDTEPKATQQLLDDALVDMEAWLAGKVADKFTRFETQEYVKGAVNIRGFCSYATVADDGSGVAWGSFGHVGTGTNAAFGGTVATQADKLHDLVGTLKSGYLSNARWATRRKVITLIRKFKVDAATGPYVWQPGLTVGAPETILGYPVSRMEDMPDLAANSLSLAFGDFKRGYQIVDRSGIRVLRDNLTSKPFVKFYTTKRTGGGVLDFEAIKFMKFA